ADTALLVIDVQEKLMPKIPDAAAIVRNIAFLVDAARLLQMPVLATEQYPKGLGPTVPQLARRLPERPDKATFSGCAEPSVGGMWRPAFKGISGWAQVRMKSL